MRKVGGKGRGSGRTLAQIKDERRARRVSKNMFRTAGDQAIGICLKLIEEQDALIKSRKHYDNWWPMLEDICAKRLSKRPEREQFEIEVAESFNLDTMEKIRILLMTAPDRVFTVEQLSRLLPTVNLFEIESRLRTLVHDKIIWRDIMSDGYKFRPVRRDGLLRISDDG